MRGNSSGNGVDRERKGILDRQAREGRSHWWHMP